MKTSKSYVSVAVSGIVLLALSAILMMGCAPRLVLDPGIPSVNVNVPSIAPPPSSTPAAPNIGSDMHFIQPNDFFYAEEPWGDNDWIYVKLGKLVTPPSPETKNQAEFMNSSTGKKEWAKWWAVTRIATRADLALGTEVIMFDKATDNSIYISPESTQEARTNSWFMARITDVSELFKGYVLVSGGYKISEKNIRIIVK